MEWKTLLAYMTGIGDQELLLRSVDLVTEHRLFRKQGTGRVRLSDGECKALAEVPTIVPPDTILVWDHKLLAKIGYPISDQRVYGLCITAQREEAMAWFPYCSSPL
jgi:hypothetical protein